MPHGFADPSLPRGPSSSPAGTAGASSARTGWPPVVDAAGHFAADRFAAAQAAIRGARHAVMLIGWRFDLRIRLDPLSASPVCPTNSSRS